MTKADWLDFFEAINGRSATEEEIAAALAAGEFQVPKKRNHSQLSLVPKKRNHSRLLRVHKTRQRKLLLQMLRQPKHNQPLRVLKLLQYKECQIKQRNHKLVLRMLKLVLLTVNLFNQVKTFNLSMDKP